MRSGYGAQMGSVFMSMSVRNRMGRDIPVSERPVIAGKPILPAPPARVFDSKYIGSYLSAPERDSIYRERIQIDDAIRKLQEPLRPSLEVEKASKRMFYNKLSELDAKLRDQLSKGLLTPQQYMERTEAYRNEFDTAVQRADIRDLQGRLASVGLPAPTSNLPASPIVPPSDFRLAEVLNPEGDLTRPIRISETPISATPAVFRGTRPASQIERPLTISIENPRVLLNQLFGELTDPNIEEEAYSRTNVITGGRPELQIGSPNVSGMVTVEPSEPSGIVVPARRRGRPPTRPETIARREQEREIDLRMGEFRSTRPRQSGLSVVETPEGLRVVRRR